MLGVLNTYKSEVLGLLPDSFSRWMPDNRRRSIHCRFVEQVVGHPLEQEDQKTIPRTCERRQLSIRDCPPASQRVKVERLKEALDRLEQLGTYTTSGTYATLLRQCVDARSLSEGKRLHTQIIRNGFEHDRFLGNLLVHMYGNCGSLDDARIVFDAIRQRNAFSWNIMLVAYAQNGRLEESRSLFDKMPQRNVVSWTAIITAYSQSGHGEKALELFRLMNLNKVKANKITFISVLDACASLQALAKGKEIHASIVRNGFESDVFVGNGLLNMYSKCGSLDDARRVFEKMTQRNVISWTTMISAYSQNGNLGDARSIFDEMPQRNVVSWTAMIAAYTQHGHGKEALELYRWMGLEGISPNKITFINVLDACASQGALAQGRVIHANIVDTGFDSDVVVGNALIDMYGKCGSLDDVRIVFDKIPQRNVISWTALIAAYAQNGRVANARKVFDKMPQQNVVSWTAMITAYAQNGHGEEAIKLFQWMGREGVAPNKVTFISVLDACASLRDLAQGKKIHANIIKGGFESDVVVGNALINMYGKCGSLDDARDAFGKTPQRNVISWTAMITAYTQNGHAKEALELFQQMESEAVKPDKITFIIILDACASLAALAQGKRIYASIVDGGFESDVVVGTALVNMFGKCGNLDDARRIFDEMPHRNVVSWTAMIAAYAQNGHGKEALKLFGQMDLEGMNPNQITFTSALDACASLTALVQGKKIHARIVDCGFESDVVVGTALVNMYGKCGSLDDARSVFDKMPRRNVVSWNAMIAAYAQDGQNEVAIEFFQWMDVQAVRPDNITFIGILFACSHACLLDDGWHYFVSMSRDHGITPTMEHYGCMADLIGRAGDLDEAEDLINGMPFKSDAVMWMTLLGACRIHGDVEQGARAAEHVFELDPTNAAPYALLSNIFAAAGKQGNAAKVRKMMEDRGTKKHAG